MNTLRVDPPLIQAQATVARGWQRFLRGLRYRRSMNRADASPLVASLDNFGERIAALEACAHVIEATPQNVHAHLHMIDLCTRRFSDLHAAARHRDRALLMLDCQEARELVESFYVYCRVTTLPRRERTSRRHHLLSDEP